MAVGPGRPGWDPLTELFLIVGICASGLAFATFVGRWLSSLSGGGSDVQRLVAAIDRAGESLFARQLRASTGAAALLLPVPALVVALAASTPESPWTPALLSVLAYVVGFVSTCAFAYVAARLAVRSVPRVHEATRRSLTGAGAIALRGGAAAGSLTEAASLLVVCAQLAMLYAIYRGDGVAALDTEAMRLAVIGLPSLAAGGAVAAMSFQLTGTSYGAAAAMGGHTATATADVPSDDARNPALVSDLVGRQLASVLGTFMDAFAGSLIAHVAALLAVVAVVQVTGAPPGEALALLGLPLVIRGVGLVATMFGAFSGHTGEAEPATAALWRAQLSAATIACGGIVGACVWAVGAGGWHAPATCASVGVLSAVGIPQLSRYPVLPEGHPLRRDDDSRPTPLTASLRGGLVALTAPAFVLAFGLGVAYTVGQGAATSGGGLLGIALFLSGYLALTSTTTGISAFAAIADTAKGLSAFVQRDGTSETRRRAALLEDAGIVARSVAFAWSCGAGVVALLLGTAFCIATEEAAGVRHTLVLGAGALLGSAFVLLYVSRSILHGTRSAAEMRADVERQLASASAGPGRSVAPDFAPNYQSCTDCAERHSVSGTSLLATAAVATPVVVAALLRFALGAERGVQQSALVAFCIALGLSAVVAALGIETTHNALRRRRARLADGPPARSDAGLLVFAGFAAASPAHTLTKATAAACLLAAPILN